MSTRRATATLSMAGRAIEVLLRTRLVLTQTPLGLRSQLDEMADLVGCDCVLLASSLPAADTVGHDSDHWRWTIHRAAPDKYRWLVKADSHLAAEGFKELAGTLTSVAEGAQLTLATRDAKGRLYVFNDWGCQSRKFLKRLAPHRRQLQALGFKLIDEKRPIRIGKGNRKYSVTHVGVVLLGAVNIGRWEIGESYLVFLDVEKGHKRVAASKQWSDPVDMECIPFLAYLSEVNSHFDRLSSVNRLLPTERSQRMKKMTAVELDAYIRSASRLGPLLDADLPATMEALIQMQGIVDTLDASTPLGEVAELKQRLEDALTSFSVGGYAVVEDSRRVVSDVKKTERSAHVRRQVDWTLIWWDLEVIHGNSHHSSGVAYGEWSSRLPGVLTRMLTHLDATPAEAWLSSKNLKDGLLTLNGPCLAGFLVTQILAHCRPRIDPGATALHLAGKSDARAHEALAFARKLVCAVRYALGCTKANEEVLRSLLWLLSEIGHDAFDVDRRLDFESHLCIAAMEQPALYGLKPFYRDHLNHVIQVCLTGWMLLEAQYKPGKGAPRGIGCVFATAKQKHDDLLGQWFLASLLHDVGYVIDVGTGWAELLDRFKNSALPGLSKQVTSTIKNWGDEKDNMDAWSKWGCGADWEPANDHGVVSALHVHGVLKTLDAKLPEDYLPALKAIAHHNHPKAEILFASERLSVLLALCDELQEWDRPWLDLDRAGLALSTLVAFGPNQARQWYKPLGKVTANLRVSSITGTPPKPVLTVNGTVLDFTVEYRDDIHRSHSIFNAWLGRSRSFQRIKLDGCPLDFRCRLKSIIAPPTVLTGRDASEPELARLWRIMRDERVWFIHKWLEQASNGKPPPDDAAVPSVQGVMYKIEDTPKGKAEVVVLDVRKLGIDSPISGDLKDFWKAVTRWRHAGESMEDPA